MRKKRALLLACLLVAVLSAATWRLGLNSWGPWYGGRPLGFWLDQYGASPGDYKPSPKADEALRHIGTNAVPHLLRLLQATNSIATAKALAKQAASPYASTRNTAYSSAKLRLMTFVEKYTPFRFKRPPVYLGSGPRIRAHPHPPPASWHHWQAYLGFQALGSLGKAAIPDLVKLAHDPNGSSAYPNIQGMKNIDAVAAQADNSGTYVAVGDSPSEGGTFLRNTQPFLVDGEIAAWSLAAIGAESVAPLMELLDDPNARLKSRAAEALGMMGGDAEPAVPALIKMLHYPDMDVRMRAADALGWIGRQPEIAVPALTQALTDPEEGVDYYAALSLGSFGERAASAIPALLADFASRDYRNKDSAALALSKISPDTVAKEVIPVLIHDVEVSQNGSGNMSLITLSQMKDQPQLVIPALIEATDDSNQMLRNNAILLLGGFGPAAKAAVPKLTSLTNSPDSQTRDDAVRALQKIEPSR